MSHRPALRSCCLPVVCLALALILAAGPALAADISPYGNPISTVTIRGVAVRAEVVSNSEKLYLGLGDRPGLSEGTGMLFIMPAREVQLFCMRGMQFPLDFIWIDHDRVLGLENNVQADDARTIASPEPVKYVLEVPAGFAARHRLQVGDPVVFRP